MGEVPLEVEVAAWFLKPFSGFGFEPFFVNSKQVVSSFFVIIFAIVGLAKPDSTYPPHRAFWGLFRGFDLFTHCFAGVTHLVDGEGCDPLVYADSH